MASRSVAIAGLVAGALAASVATAGGPLAVRTNGQPFVWSTGAQISYRTDNGPLSASVNESQARGRVLAMFNVWENVPSASISYDRAGFISSVPGFGGGDVNTGGEFNAVEGDCGGGGQSPIIYDAAAQIFIALGIDEEGVIGFAGPCAIDLAQGRILTGIAVMNGLFQDGQANPVQDLTTAAFDATFIHEFGHFSGLDHSQINVGCASGFCNADDLAGLPTMFPFLVGDAQVSLSIDDVAWISRLYPAAGGSGFNATHGTITGTVYFSDGESHAQFANVVARRVDTGGNQDRRLAASVVSGFRFRACHPNAITNPPSDEFCPPTGSDTASHIGSFEIPLPPGSYTIEIENIGPQFTLGSSVGPSDFPIALPGTIPPPSNPIAITAGQTSPGNDVTLIGTPPRFDQFEGP